MPFGSPKARSVSSGADKVIGAKNHFSMLVLDTSYTLEMIKERGLEASVVCRDLDGFFEHVWTVHPFATLLTSERWTPRYGKAVSHELNDRHTFIEAKIGRFAWLAKAFKLNFLIGQIGLFFQLHRLIRRHNIRVIRVGNPHYLGVFGWLLARLSGVPLVIRVAANFDMVRNDGGELLSPGLFRSAATEKRVEQFILRRADLVVAPNGDNLKFALASGAREDAVALFRYGNLLAPVHRTPPAERSFDPDVAAALGVEKGKFALCVARLIPDKFPADVIKAFAAVRAKGHDLKLIMAGDGPLVADMQRLSAELGIGEFVTFPGNIDQRALSQLFPVCAAVISAHAGRALSEAAFGGAPIVAYDIDWQGELIETGVTGELVVFRDVEGMEAALQRIVEDRAYAAKMGHGARERALDMLDPDRLNEHERSVYTKLLAR